MEQPGSAIAPRGGHRAAQEMAATARSGDQPTQEGVRRGLASRRGAVVPLCKSAQAAHAQVDSGVHGRADGHPIRDGQEALIELRKAPASAPRPAAWTSDVASRTDLRVDEATVPLSSGGGGRRLRLRLRLGDSDDDAERIGDIPGGRQHARRTRDRGDSHEDILN
jgi:hypothetical protein